MCKSASWGQRGGNFKTCKKIRRLTESFGIEPLLPCVHNELNRWFNMSPHKALLKCPSRGRFTLLTSFSSVVLMMDMSLVLSFFIDEYSDLATDILRHARSVAS